MARLSSRSETGADNEVLFSPLPGSTIDIATRFLTPPENLTQKQIRVQKIYRMLLANASISARKKQEEDWNVCDCRSRSGFCHFLCQEIIKKWLEYCSIVEWEWDKHNWRFGHAGWLSRLSIFPRSSAFVTKLTSFSNRKSNKQKKLLCKCLSTTEKILSEVSVNYCASSSTEKLWKLISHFLWFSSLPIFVFPSVSAQRGTTS